jgi:aspartyl-tRNA(Asn)/glutamyl-tRNA(Gln) amidotransferase subunit C
MQDTRAIDLERVERIAKLAHLELEPAELEGMARDLGAILEYVEQLNQLDTSGVEPTAHVLDLVTVLREDRVTPSLPREQVLAGAPDTAEGHFRVPRILA